MQRESNIIITNKIYQQHCTVYQLIYNEGNEFELIINYSKYLIR